MNDETAGLRWEPTECPQCGASIARPVHRDQVGPQVVEIVECSRCEQHYLTPRPTLDTLTLCYPQDYECYERDPSKSVRRHAQWEDWVLQHDFAHPSQRRTVEDASGRPAGDAPQRESQRKSVSAAWWRAQIGRWLIRRGLQRSEWIRYRGQGRLLDVGCGGGDFLERMRQRGWNVEGLDIVPEVCQHLHAQLGVPIHCGVLPHDDLAAGSYDVITFWQVLEHLPNPLEVLMAARKLLAPGGSIVASVPNFASVSRHQFGKAWIGLDVPRHLIHYTPGSMRSMLRRAGLRPVAMRTISMDGWVRRSAMHPAYQTQRPRQAAWMNWKPWVQMYGAFTELTRRADNLWFEATADTVAVRRPGEESVRVREHRHAA